MRIFLSAYALILGLSITSVRAEETIQSRIPQAHIDAFMKDCNASVAQATCWCMVRKGNETKAGAAFIDMMGMMQLVKDDAQRRTAFLQILNRHGLRGSELMAFVDPKSGNAEALARQCE